MEHQEKFLMWIRLNLLGGNQKFLFKKELRKLMSGIKIDEIS